MAAKGEGHEKLHHSPGDAVFNVQYITHPLFTVDENFIDLVYTDRIKLVDALLGFSCVKKNRRGLLPIV